MKSGIDGSYVRDRYGTGIGAYSRVFFLVCALPFFSGCIFNELGRVVGQAIGQGFSDGIYLIEVSSAYYDEYGKWPRNLPELVAFCEARNLASFSDIEAGTQRPDVDVDIHMFKEARFYPQPDGDLKIEFSIEHKRAGEEGTKDSEAVHTVTGTVTVSPSGDGEPCDGGKTTTSVKRHAATAVQSPTPAPTP